MGETRHQRQPARLHFQTCGTHAVCARVVGEVLCDIVMPGFDFAGPDPKPSPPARSLSFFLCAENG